MKAADEFKDKTTGRRRNEHRAARRIAKQSQVEESAMKNYTWAFVASLLTLGFISPVMAGGPPWWVVLFDTSYANAASAPFNDATLDALLGLGGAAAPQFIFRQANGAYAGSFLGTSQWHYNNYPGVMEVSDGTGGAPYVASGPVLKVSRTGAPPSSRCANMGDSECTATAAFYQNGLSTDNVQTTAILGAAKSASTTAGADSIGGYFMGRITGSGVGLGTGAYMEGRRDTTKGKLVGAEVRGQNATAGACAYNTSGIGWCDALWLTSAGQEKDYDLSTAVHIAAATPGIDRWHAGVTLNQGGVTTFGIDDESSATNSYYTNGTHTYAFVAGASAGKVGIGTLTPAYPLVITTTAAGVVESQTNSAGTCNHTPGASSETVACSSDARMKEDIHDAKSALEYFGGIHVREFKVKATGETKTGVIAQEMLQNYGSMVHMGADGFYTVDEPNPWQLVKAIQELQAEIAQLRQAIK
jgi:hypothetical protein